jgi:hypothetical protein
MAPESKDHKKKVNLTYVAPTIFVSLIILPAPRPAPH